MRHTFCWSFSYGQSGGYALSMSSLNTCRIEHLINVQAIRLPLDDAFDCFLDQGLTAQVDGGQLSIIHCEEDDTKLIRVGGRDKPSHGLKHAVMTPVGPEMHHRELPLTNA